MKKVLIPIFVLGLTLTASAQTTSNESGEEVHASHPSKTSIRAKYRTYTHKTGHVIEMFPIGVTPMNNNGVHDYVTIWNKRYKA